MDTVIEDQYVPDFNAKHFAIVAAGKDLCIDTVNDFRGPINLNPCLPSPDINQKIAGVAQQVWTMTGKGYIQSAHYVHNSDLSCLRANFVSQTTCNLHSSNPDDVAHKPAPDPYLRACTEFDVAPADCVAVEDSPSGLRSAMAAGVPVVAIANPANAGLPLLDEARAVQGDLTDRAPFGM